MGKGDQDSRSRKKTSKGTKADSGIYSSKHVREQENMMMSRPPLTRSRSGEAKAVAKAKEAVAAGGGQKQKR